jgi:hypothetical protein
VGAVIATHHPAENADPIVADMGARGWVLAGVEYVAGKRVRYLVPPASKRKAGK